MNEALIKSVRQSILPIINGFPKIKISYILFFSPRSGSHLITTHLQSISHGNPFEAFHFNQAQLRQFYGWKFNFNDPEIYLQEATKTLTVNEVFGVKIHWSQFQTFIKILRDIVGSAGEELSELELIEVFFPDIRYMFLKRRNKIKQAISYSKGMQTGIWKATSEELNTYQEYVLPPKYDRLHIECCLDELLSYDERWEQLLDSLPKNYLKIWYEDLAQDFTSGMLNIYQHLGVVENTEKPKPITKKLADSKSDDWFNQFVKETDWLRDRQLYQALVDGNTRYGLITRANMVFHEKGQDRYYKMPSNRFKKLRYYIFRIQRRVRNFSS